MAYEQSDDAAVTFDPAKTAARENLLIALYAEAAHDCERTRCERDGLRKQLVQAERERSGLQDELARVHSEMEQRSVAVLNSMSWRITAPLRGLKGLWKG